MRLEMMKKLCGLISFLVLFAFAGLIAKAAPKPDKVDSLQLPVPRTFDLAHIEAQHFATALGNDPERIFRFVRDQIGYEVYTGYLRGPRGTLMALTGNSIDQAALLGSLLEHSGHRVRYVRGKLPETEAKKLVNSMWTERPRPAPTKGDSDPPAEVKKALDILVASVKRDFNLIQDHLKKANIKPPRTAAPSLDSLIKEAEEHYWVQWWKDGTWVDLDPSFADASPHRNYTVVEKDFDSLPDTLFHRVEIRIRLEEYTDDKPSNRVILKHAAKAADLSGMDLVLSHQPENWKGPATSLQDAMSSAIENTGRVKPILIIGREKWIAGEPFSQEPPPTTGMGGVFSRISGEGTRNPVPIATAEYLEFDFIYPGGRKETVVRDIFDRLGKARRAAGHTLTAEEVRKRANTEKALDVTRALYGIFITTGQVNVAHLSAVVEDPPIAEAQPVDIPRVLRRVSITFAAASDAVLAGRGLPDDTAVLFYPDSSRVQIVELSKVAEKRRLSFDLRRDQARAVMVASQREDAFFGQVFRGVVDGTLERVLMDYLTAGLREQDPSFAPVMSTSSLFELAQAKAVPTMLLTGKSARVKGDVPADTRARVHQELADDYFVVAPERVLAFAETPRFAWWRIDPQSGRTIAVTDEGLHAAVVTEYVLVESEEVTTVYAYWQHGGKTIIEVSRFARHSSDLLRYIDFLMSHGGVLGF